jgi:hypothetical protein
MAASQRNPVWLEPLTDLRAAHRREPTNKEESMTTQIHITSPSPHKAWTLAIASLGLFMVALDTFVVTTALPVLRVDLGASLSDLEWTVNAYNLSFACLLLTGAALGVGPRSL